MPTSSFNTVTKVDEESGNKLLKALKSKKKIKIFPKPVKVEDDPKKLKKFIQQTQNFNN